MPNLKLYFLSQVGKLYDPLRFSENDNLEPSYYEQIFPPVMHGTLAYQIFAVLILSIFIALIVLFLYTIYKQYKIAKNSVDTFEPKDKNDPPKHITDHNKKE